jgi:hypothetical protein
MRGGLLRLLLEWGLAARQLDLGRTPMALLLWVNVSRRGKWLTLWIKFPSDMLGWIIHSIRHLCSSHLNYNVRILL